MEFFNIQIEKLENIEYNIHLFAYSLTVLLVPFLIGHPQIIVGVIVNAALILAAEFLDFKGTLPVIMLPSVGVLTRGLIFGPFTVFLIYMIPFIWIGNGILVYAMKYFRGAKKINYFVSLGISAALKAGFLFGSAFVLVNLGILPPIFLATMGLMQVTTALIGGAASFGVIKGRKLIR